MTDKDYLLTRPAELLTEIFEHAYAGSRTTTGALSRTLLPYHRAEKFKEVKVRMGEQLVRLANRLKKDPEKHLSAYVKLLHYDSCDCTTEDEELRRSKSSSSSSFQAGQAGPSNNGLAQGLPLLQCSLTSLSIVLEPETTSLPVNQHLPHFHTLKHLHLDATTFNAGTLDSNLSQLPLLTTLSFGKGARPEPRGLADLVDGPKKLPSLRRISLFPDEPSRRGRKGCLTTNNEDSPYYIGPGWVVPDFEHDEGTLDFNSSGMESLLDDCERGGVRFEGMSQKDIDIYREWRQEARDRLYEYAEKFGDQPGVFEEVEDKMYELFPNEEVREILLSLREQWDEAGEGGGYGGELYDW
ncbi:hypothetical protein JCM8547_009223 [Rhodosporidiobolus lusitaniae]